VGNPRWDQGPQDAILASALRSIPPAVVLFDSVGSPVWCNSSMKRLLSGHGDGHVELENVFTAALSDGSSLGRALSGAGAGTATRIESVVLVTSSGQVAREGWVGPVPGPGDRPSGMAVLVLPADEERLHPLLAHTYDIISVLDRDGTIRYSNPAAGKLMAYERTVLAGTNAVDLVHPDDQASVAEALSTRAATGEPTRMRLRFGDGRWHHCLVHAADLIDDPAVGGIVVTVHDITDQVEAHDELLRSEQWVRRLLAQLTDVVVVIDQSAEISYASPSIERLLGNPDAAHPGTPAFETIHPDDVGAVEEKFLTVLAEPEAEHRVTFRLQHTEGHWVWVEAVAVNALADPAVEGIIATLRDITQLKQAEEMSTGLVAAAPDAMIVVDGDGTVVLANDRAEALFGWPADELVGQTVESLIPAELRSRHRAHRAAYGRDPHGRMMGEGIELVALRRDGSEVPVEVSLSTHDTHRGRLTSASIRDITVQRETRRALEAALRGEQEVVQRLREADELKAEFVSTVAHELKGPLAAVSGFSRLIERMIAAEAIRSADIPVMASRVTANADRLLDMIEQLLRFSRLESGGQLDREDVRLLDIVGRSVDLVQERLAEHRLQVDVAEDLVVFADPEGIANVLRNLLTNAAKFGPAGTTIWLSATKDDVGAVTVTVADEGPGVDPGDRDRVFEQFKQTAEGKAKGGSGLGLSIARRYVELHGGSIGVDDRPGGGARFSFTLPGRPT
jgi:PAS domain S-box-containing protein